AEYSESESTFTAYTGLNKGRRLLRNPQQTKTGIVLCDLIDCANTFKEIITMPARSLCQKSFKNILEPLHLYRRQSLIEATSVVINGASLTLIQYWA
ncbi:hypothetical protein EBD50_19815, partial [Salmonella enterica subsp. enterica]|nr:hypothetical protein [Salmonella enterica subsp. enterica]